MEQTVSAPDATPTQTPDASTFTSLADYEAARPQLLRDTTPTFEPGESADAQRQRLLQEQADRAPERTRDERGRFARQEGDAGEAPEPAQELAAEPSRESAEAPRRKNPQERIAHVVWEREQARREAEAARRELDALRAQLAHGTAPAADPRAPQAPPPVDASDPEPTEEQFDTYREFVRAQAQWAARQQLQQFVQFSQQQVEQQSRAQEQQAVAATFAQRMAEAEQATPDLLTRLSPEVLNVRPSWALGPHETPTGENVIGDLAVHRDRPEALLLHLSEHPEDFRRISALHPMLAMRELTLLESRLETASRGSVPTPSPLSQAQPPIQPVGRGASVPTGTRDPKDISSLAEYEALRPSLVRAFGGTR